MTLDRLRPVTERVLDPVVAASVRIGVTPNLVSVVAFGLAVAAAAAFYRGGVWYLAGAVLVGLNGWLDLLDGALARELDAASPAGDFLDHVLDRYADVVLVAGLAAGVGRVGLGFAAVTGVLMTSYLGTQAAAVGLDRVYAGVLGRADRLVLIGAVAVAAPFAPRVGPLTVVGWLLVLLAVVGHATAVQRFVAAWRAL